MGITFLSQGKPDHPVLGQNDQRNQKEKIIVQTRPCKVRFLCHACEVVVLFLGIFLRKNFALHRVYYDKPQLSCGFRVVDKKVVRKY